MKEMDGAGEMLFADCFELNAGYSGAFLSAGNFLVVPEA
jgi:hypothetical protein